MKLIKKFFKNILRVIFNLFTKSELFSKVLTLIGTYDFYEKKIFQGKNFYLLKKNDVTKFRNDTIFTKEPETIEWIKNMSPDSTFWDVGANVGLYSIVAALTKSKQVVAFEPSYFNLTILSKNIFKNDLSDKIIISPIPINQNSKKGSFYLQSTEEGYALANFKENKTDDVDKKFKYNTISMSLDEFYGNYHELKPDYLKIDVDGIETKIIKGASKVLNIVKSVLIEANSELDEKEIIDLMKTFNLILFKKYSQTSNLIFIRE